MHSRGLSRVSSSELQRLLRGVHRGHFSLPLSRAGLIAGGFGDIEEHLGPLVGLEQVPIVRLIAAVLAERGSKAR
jgi:hypothetical protein